MIRNEKLSAIVMINEYGWMERSHLVAAKKEGIPVIAIQHGIIHPSHSGYIYDVSEIDGTINSPYCPIPDKIAVSGDYYYDLLTKVSSYPEDSIVVTGQPRYDILFHAPNIYSKKKILEKYNINPNHKIILWTTQCHGLSDEENYKNCECLFKTIQRINNVTLIVKQHPRESKRYTRMIMKYVKKSNNVLLIPKNSDTYELIYACDLLITKTSTTAMEAAALNKPVIVLDLSGTKDSTGYVKDGIAVGVYKSDDLELAIRNLLCDDSILLANRKNYLKNHFYRIDGKSSSRVADLIIKVVS